MKCECGREHVISEVRVDGALLDPVLVAVSRLTTLRGTGGQRRELLPCKESRLLTISGVRYSIKTAMGTEHGAHESRIPS